MSSYILILFLLVNQGLSVATITFDTKTNCEKALKTIADDNKDTYGTVFNGYCVEK